MVWKKTKTFVILYLSDFKIGFKTFSSKCWQAEKFICFFFAYFVHWNISACVCPSTFWHFCQQFRQINVGFSYTDLRLHFKIFSAFRINPKNNNLWSLAWTPSSPTFCGYVGGKLQAAHCYYSQVHGSPLMKGLRDLWDPEGPAHLFHCTKSSTGIRWSLFRREDQWIFVSCCPYMYCMPCLAVGWPALKALKSLLRKFKIFLDGEGYINLGKRYILGWFDWWQKNLLAKLRAAAIFT